MTKDLAKANELIQKLEEIGAPELLLARLKAWVENQASNMPWDKTPYLDGAIHGWFELSYASYLVLPRTMLQSMPLQWQEDFVAHLEELERLMPAWPGHDRSIEVHLRDDNTHRYVSDPLVNYERGRRRLPLKTIDKQETERQEKKNEMSRL
jgi:hypothetical protein